MSCQNNYILKLTGWRAWWDQVLRKESRCEEIPTPGDKKLKKILSKNAKSEEEKRLFIAKFFPPKITRSEPEPRMEKRPDEMCKNPSNLDIDVQPKANGRSTPGKRKKDFSILEGGKTESPVKKQRIFKFRGGGPVSADFYRLITVKNNLESADVIQTDRRRLSLVENSCVNLEDDLNGD